MQEGFALVIRIAKLPDSSLIERRLVPIRHILCASPGYLAENGTPETPDDLIHHHCLNYNLLADNDQWLLQNTQGKTITTKIRPYLHTSSDEFLHCLCRSR